MFMTLGNLNYVKNIKNIRMDLNYFLGLEQESKYIEKSSNYLKKKHISAKVSCFWRLLSYGTKIKMLKQNFLLIIS